jgi:acyl-CoA thioester hydrolase
MELLHRIDIPVRWGDMDALAHVNNTAYFVYMEQARVSWLQSAIGDVSKDHPVGPILASTSCQFRLPVTFPETLTVSVYLERLGSKSMTLKYEMLRQSDGQIAAEGDSVLVWFDFKAGHSVPIPGALLPRQA